MPPIQAQPYFEETPDPELLRRRRTCFSLHGEDAIFQALLVQQQALRPVGFYVDVGAFHPYIFSNTAAFHEQGWRGINVEPNPEMAARLRTARPDDVTLDTAVGADPGRANLQVFSEWASSNTLVEEFAATISSSQNVPIERTVDVEVLPLHTVLERHGPADGTIDIMSVDVEGLDLEVLQSNNWTRFRPLVLGVEDLGIDLLNPASSPIVSFMDSVGYRFVAHAVLTSFYIPRSE